MARLPSFKQVLSRIRPRAKASDRAETGAGSRSAAVQRGWRLWRYMPGWNPYHGLWGPGIHLLRNLDLQRKSLVVGSLVSVLVLTLLFQLGQLRLDQFSMASRAVADTGRIRLLDELQHVGREWAAEVAALSHGRPAPNLPKLRADEASVYAQFKARVADGAPRGSVLARLLDELEVRRRALLAFKSPDKAAGGTVGPQHMAAARAYSDALVRLRGEMRSLWASEVDSDAEHRALREGLVELAAELTLRVHRLVGAELEALDSGSVSAQRESENLRAEARTVLSLSRPMLERARVVLPGQATLIDEQLLLVSRLLDASAGLSRGRSALPTGDALAVQAADTAAAAEQFRATGRAAMVAIRGLGTLGLDALEQALKVRRAQVAGDLLLQAVGLGGMLLFTLYLLVSMYKVLAGGLKFLGAQVEELGRGNLSIRPSGHGRDEIGVALTTLGRSASQMSALFTAVTQGVAAVSHASREVASGNANLNGRTGEIRDAIGLVAARTTRFANAMEYCGAAVERVAEHVRIMRIEGQRGRKSTRSLQERMRSLQGKSREITQVVSLVEAVAHQTKLLALNASVEAARAGAQGKGFAVVAQEVRSLAGRSENAARRIRAIVDASVEEIEEGSLTAKRVGESVSRSDNEVESVNAIMGEIVGLMREGQSQAREVLETAHDVDDAAGGNARTVQLLSEASAELRDQGDSLKRSVQHFVTG